MFERFLANYRQRVFNRSGKLFVVCTKDGRDKRFLSETAPATTEPVLIYPAEPGDVAPYWFATCNPEGIMAIPAADTPHSTWSIVAVRVPASELRVSLKDAQNRPVDLALGRQVSTSIPGFEVKFYLRDKTGQVEEIKWGQPHQAVYFVTWEEYHGLVKDFWREYDNYVKDMEELPQHVNKLTSQNLIPSSVAAYAYSFIQGWTENFIHWVKKDGSPKKRLRLAKERLADAQTALKILLDNHGNYQIFRRKAKSFLEGILDFREKCALMAQENKISETRWEEVSDFVAFWETAIREGRYSPESEVHDFENAFADLKRARQRLQELAAYVEAEAALTLDDFRTAFSRMYDRVFQFGNDCENLSMTGLLSADLKAQVKEFLDKILQSPWFLEVTAALEDTDRLTKDIVVRAWPEIQPALDEIEALWAKIQSSEVPTDDSIVVEPATDPGEIIDLPADAILTDEEILAAEATGNFSWLGIKDEELEITTETVQVNGTTPPQDIK